MVIRAIQFSVISKFLVSITLSLVLISCDDDKPCGQSEFPQCGGICEAGLSCAPNAEGTKCTCTSQPCGLIPGTPNPYCGGVCANGGECASTFWGQETVCTCITPCGRQGNVCGGDCLNGGSCEELSNGACACIQGSQLCQNTSPSGVPVSCSAGRCQYADEECIVIEDSPGGNRRCGCSSANYGYCGDGVRRSNPNGNGSMEECDSGSQNGTTDPLTQCPSYCSASCKTNNALCGDGCLGTTEQCDDGNNQSSDGCSANCTIEAAQCHDGIVQYGEECDDGNYIDSDFCVDCKQAQCGDGRVWAGIEVCDMGTSNGWNSSCSPTCKKVCDHSYGACEDSGCVCPEDKHCVSPGPRDYSGLSRCVPNA